MTPYDRRTGEGLLRNLVVREGRRTGQLQVRLVTSPAKLDSEALASAQQRRRGAVDADRVRRRGDPGRRDQLLTGADRLEEELGGMRFRISPQAFFQTNTEMAERLYAVAVEYAQLTGYERVYDLYCGIGTIGLLMAPRVAEVWGLELVEDAIADAIANARLNEIDNAHFFAGDVRLAMRELVETAGTPRRAGRRPAARRALPEGRATAHRGLAEADRVRLLQPDDARARTPLSSSRRATR